MTYTKITVHCLCLIYLRDKFRIPARNSWFSTNTNPTGEENVRMLLLNILQEHCLWKNHLPIVGNYNHLYFSGLQSHNVHIECCKDQYTGSYLKTQRYDNRQINIPIIFNPAVDKKFVRK
jgi:hypothetical protein